MKSTRAGRGFTLIEALVAITLLALMFGALMPVFQQGLAVLRSSDRHSQAVLLAQSILEHEATVGSEQGDAATQSSTSRGVVSSEGDFRWQVTRTPFVDELLTPDGDDPDSASGAAVDYESSPVTLVQISVVVRWPQNEFGVQLHSLVLENTR